MKLKEIHRTATFAWSPLSSLPLLVTGTVAGALDESFSNESVLEIWKPDWLNRAEYELGEQGGKGPVGVVKDGARFNRLAWGATDVIAAGMENGELALWDAPKILGDAPDEALVLRNNQHTGPVRGLDFNPIQTNLLSSGAIGGDVCIWDLKDPSKPYTPTPGTRSAKLDEITSIAWNRQVPYVLGGSSTTGYTVVWDLRGKREVVALAYGGGQGMVSGARRGMSDLAWCPDNATRVVTASEDDSSPVIMVWDLRNARAPEKILTGHEKGILSLSWCKHDPDLLLSGGKDNRTLCWNPTEGNIIAELPPSNNWSFQTTWNPRNPSVFATAFFDGTIGIHSIQSTADEPPSSTVSATPAAASTGEDDLFASIATTAHSQPVSKTTSLSVDAHTPDWYKRPVSVGWGFGGRVVSVSNLLSSGARKWQSGVVHLRKGVVTEGAVVDRAKKLLAGGEEGMKQVVSDDLVGMFEVCKAGGDKREALIRLLGYEKEEGVKRVRDGLKVAIEGIGKKEPEKDEQPEEATPTPAAEALLADEESSTLFSHETPMDDAANSLTNDIFSTIAANASVAATTGSPLLQSLKGTARTTFKIMDESGSDVEKVITQALIYGDFPSAVDVCVGVGRWADALVLAGSAKDSEALVRQVQKAYFEEMMKAKNEAGGSIGYLRVWQSVIWMNDLEDVVQNADLSSDGGGQEEGWKQVFILLCIYSRSDSEFRELVEQLGRRLEWEGEKSRRKETMVCYLASGRLEKIVSLWLEEMAEEERVFNAQGGGEYHKRVEALQKFMEKVFVYRSITGYVDSDLPSTSSAAAEWKLGSLYERYLEYAEVLAGQGMIEEAGKVAALVPGGFGGEERGRLVGLQKISASVAKTTSGGYSPTSRGPYGATTTYGASTTTTTSPYGVVPTSSYPPPSGAYGAPATGHGKPSHQPTAAGAYAPPPVSNFVSSPQQGPYQQLPPPPGRQTGALPPPPTRPKENGGWNDAPPIPNRPNSAKQPSQPSVVTSSFLHQQPQGPVGRSGNREAASMPPPPKAGLSHQQPPSGRMMSPPNPSMARAPTPSQYAPPPPALRGGAPPPPQPYGHPSTSQQPHPPGPYGAPSSHAQQYGPPPTGQPHHPPPRPSSGYGPPPNQHQPSNAFAPPDKHHHPPPPAPHHSSYGPPPGGAGPYAPTNPPGGVVTSPPQGAPPLLATPGTGGPPAAPPAVPPKKAAPLGPKYPPGDRSHIPDHARPVFEVISGVLSAQRAAAGPAQKRLFDDLERRMNPLFDALNCGTLSDVVIESLVELARAMEARDKGTALGIHVDLITKGTQGDAIGMPMSGIKQLIMRL